MTGWLFDMEHDKYHCRPFTLKLKLDISVRIETLMRMDIWFINYNKQESKKMKREITIKI